MKPAAALAALALIAAAAPARAQDDDRPSIEISLGAGIATASEASLFDLPVDAESDPDVLIDFRVRQNRWERLALGFHVYGTIEETPRYRLVDGGGNVRFSDFDLTVFHLGVDFRYVFADGRVQPFVEIGGSYVAGSAEADDGEILRLSGGSIGGGPGFQVAMSRGLAVGMQGLFTAGFAKWEERPFFESTGRDYEPGFAGFEGFVTYRWHR